MTGEVQLFEPWKGFGVIMPQDDTDDVSVHHSGIVAEREFLSSARMR